MGAEPNQGAAAAAAMSGNAPPQRKRNWLGWGLAVFILVGCLVFLDIGAIGEALAAMSAGEIVLILGLFTIDRLLMGYKWSLLLRIVDAGLPHWRVVKLFYQGSLCGVFMPSHVGGDILRAYWASRANGKAHESYASIVMERLLGLISAVNWAILGGLFCVFWLQPPGMWIWALLGVAGVIAANGVFLLSLQPYTHEFVLRFLAGHGGRLAKVAALLHRFYEAYSRFSRDGRALALNFGLTVIEHGVQMLAFFAIAMAIGVEAGVVIFIAATAVQMFLFRIPIAPDGWGVGELTAIAVYGVIGIAAEQAFTISFLAHIFVLLALLPALVLLLRGHTMPTAKELARIEAQRQAIQEAEAAAAASVIAAAEDGSDMQETSTNRKAEGQST